MTQDVRILAAAWIACAVTVGLALLVMELQHVPWLLASLGGSCVIVFGMPDSKMAQPRSLLGGHVIGSVVGLAAAHLLGSGWLAMAAATATALVLMMLTDSIHSPAGADPLIVMSTQASWSFLIAPLGLGLLIVFLATVMYHRFVLGRPYPSRAVSGSRTADETAAK
jgi:CBS-domain-containing membrane protein